MKRIIIFVCLIMATIGAFAQSTLVATLSHGESINTFYGAYAFQNAHKAAVDGDVINLSGGGFQAVDITKAITVRGTGVADSNPTIISGIFSIDIPNSATDRLSFEGCRIVNQITIKDTLKNAYFLRDSIADIYIYNSDNTYMENIMFANCQVSSFDLYRSSTVQFFNSHVGGFHNHSDKTASASFVNCVIEPSSGYHATSISTSQLVNCILYWTVNNTYSLPNTSTAINCVAVGDGSSICFRDVASKQNCSYADMTIFTNSDSWQDLTDDAKAKYLGNDGTPVGMYGGTLPYSLTPSYPQITNVTIPSKTTADGKLSVAITVSATE